MREQKKGMNKNKRILVFGQTFNNFSGGGITLTNLFKGWPKDNISVLFVPYGEDGMTTDVCDKYYQIGAEEHIWRFPFNLVKKSFPSSGLVTRGSSNVEFVHQSKNGIKHYFSSRFLNPLINWVGFSHSISGISISQKMKRWLSEYNPEILYLQVSTREGILFASQLIDYLKIPSAIHMMDDWPSTISDHGPLRKYWKAKIDREFRQLLNKVDIHLSISDAMSDEYNKRYHKQFQAFHNPVEIESYSIPGKKENHPNRFRILYLGRIGTANKASIVLFAKAISHLKIDNQRIELDIYSKDADIPDLKLVNELENVKVMPPVPYEAVPGMLKEYDLLFLPLDFTENGLKFARFSIPTKATEYMLSGIPVFVLAPEETAVYRFFKNNSCGFCISSPNEEEILEGIRFIIRNEEYRNQIGNKAENLARRKFDATIVRQKFQGMLTDLSH